MTTTHEEVVETQALVRTVSAHFVGKSASVQGAALADLLALWLAAHVVRGDPKKTAWVREEMLAIHLAAVRGLIEPNYKTMVEPQLKANTQ